MPISYDGQKIVPAPQIGMKKSYLRTGDGKKVGATFTITLNGDILPFKGSPEHNGVFIPEGGNSAFVYEGKPGDCVNNSTSSSVTKTQINPMMVGTNPNSFSYALFKKTEAIRDLFAIEGKLFRVLSWWDKSNHNETDSQSTWPEDEETYFPSVSGYPRIVDVSFDTSYYNSKVPYTITLEMDEFFGLNSEGSLLGNQLGDEDYRNASANIIAESGESFTDVFYDSGGNGYTDDYAASTVNRIYVADVTESWSVNQSDQFKGTNTYDNSGGTLSTTIEKSPIFTLSHEVSAVGKRAYNGGGLIREPWENARFWVESRLGIPHTNPSLQHWPMDSSSSADLFTDEQNGFTIDPTYSNQSSYGPYNYVRTNNLSKTGGTYAISENWTLAKIQPNAEVTEKIGFSITSEKGGSVSNVVSINGEINGFEKCTVGRRITVLQNKFDSAKARFDVLTENDGNAGGIIPRLALAKAPNIKYPYASKTVSKNTKNGVISFTYNFNDRIQHVTGSISETVQIQKTCAQNKYAEIQVPDNAAGPRIYDLNTRDLNTATVSIQVSMGSEYRSTRPSSTEIDGLWDTVWDGTVVVDSPDYLQLTILMETEKKETWDPISGRYSKSITYKWDGCDCGNTVTYT
jgi:hypothetical protein